MSAFFSLVRLFVRDLIRRKLFWALVVVMIGSAAIAYWTNQQMVDAMGRGESYDMASRRAASNLDHLADSVRTWLYIAVILLAAQVAPESRKNGTAQFVLSQGVRRDVLAASQLTALAFLITSGVLLVHA